MAHALPAGAFASVLMMNSVDPTWSASVTTSCLHSGWTSTVRLSRRADLAGNLDAQSDGVALAAGRGERRAELVADYTEKYANPYSAAERGYVDDVIDPAETRIKLINGLQMLQTKREELPRRKHGNMPL